MTTVFINEFHYDNIGADSGEFLEIAGLAGFDLSGWNLELYNGNGGSLYDTIPLSGVLADDSGNGYGFLTVTPPGVSIQNGAPDGIALVNASNDVVEFLSYEGSFTATDGTAAGLTSTDINAFESSSTPTGHSLQRVGIGSTAADFSFTAPQAETPGAVNTGQVFSAAVNAELTDAPDPANVLGINLADQLAIPAGAEIVDFDPDHRPSLRGHRRRHHRCGRLQSLRPVDPRQHQLRRSHLGERQERPSGRRLAGCQCHRQR